MAFDAAPVPSSTSKMVLWPASEKKNPGNLLGIHFNGYRLMAGAVQNRRNLARDTHTARRIFVELAHAGLGYDYFRHLSLISCSGTKTSY
jgi:hypothetical protein